MKNLKDFCYPAIYYIDEKDNLVLEFPDIPEAYTFAENKNYNELWKNAREVLELSIEGKIEDKEDLPEPTNIDDIKLEKDQKIVLINVVVNEKIKYVKKTLTIPESLNQKSLKYNINFSKVLTKALENEIEKIRVK
jgi:antitoxin HicB